MFIWSKSIAVITTATLASACGGDDDGPHPSTTNIGVIHLIDKVILPAP